MQSLRIQSAPLVISSLLTVIPLTADNVRDIFEKTSNLKKLCGFSLLNIPHDKCGNAATAAEWFVNHTSVKKTWRWMIYCLDFIGDTALADSIMDRAEPPAGVEGVSLDKTY